MAKLNTILKNGTNNEALPDSGSVLVGSHLKSRSPNQQLYGQYNDIDGDASADIMQVGSGLSEENRNNAIRTDSNGITTIRGGQVYMDSTVGSIVLRVPVVMTINNKIQNVYID